jgi:hypothetical protein
LRHVLAGTAEHGPAVGLVLLRSIVVAGPASLAAGIERLLQLSVGHSVTVDMTVKALETVMHGVRDVIGKCRTVAAGLVTVGADRAVNGFVFLILGSSNSGASQETQREYSEGYGERTSDRGGFLGS